MRSKKRTARIAGLLYLAVIVFGVYAEVTVRSRLIDPDNAAATFDNLVAAGAAFRLGFVSDLIMITCFFFLPLVLYRLFRPVDAQQARLMVACVLVGVAVLCVNMLNHFAADLLSARPTYLQALSKEQSQALLLFFLDLHKNGYRIAQIFFGLWLFPLGYLVYRSGFMPRLIGILLMVSCGSFLLDFFLFFLLPGYSASTSSLITFPTVIGEFSFCLWLLIKGVRSGETSGAALEKDIPQLSRQATS